MVLAQHDAAGNTIGISVNNGTLNTAALSGGPFDGGGPTSLGALASFASQLDGRLGPVMFWKRLLTSQEKSDL